MTTLPMQIQLNSFLSELDQQNGYAESTRQAYACDLQKFTKFLSNKLGHEPQVSDFTPQTIKKFLDKEKRSGLKPSTLHRRRVSLKRFAVYLANNGFTSSGLAEAISGLQTGLWREIAKTEVSCLVKGQIEALFEAVEQTKTPRSLRDLAILSLLFEVGLSIGDVILINLSDLDLRAGRLSVYLEDGQENYISIKKSAPNIQAYLKTGRPELTQYLNEEALFVSQMGGRISRQGVWQVVRNWGKVSGLSQPLSPRIIRHTAAYRMVKEGKSIEEIQRLLGHRNLLSTRALVRRLKKTCDARA